MSAIMGSKPAAHVQPAHALATQAPPGGATIPAVIPAVPGSEGSGADTARHLLNHLTAAKAAGHAEGVKFYKGELSKLKGVKVTQGSDQMEGIANA